MIFLTVANTRVQVVEAAEFGPSVLCSQCPIGHPSIEQDEHDQDHAPLQQAGHDTERFKRIEPAIRRVDERCLVKPPTEEYHGKRGDGEANSGIP